MLKAPKFIGQYLKSILSFVFCIFLITGSVSCIAGTGGQATAAQRQEFLLNRHIKNNRQDVFTNDLLVSAQPSEIRSGKKALKPVGQVLNKIILVCLNAFPQLPVKLPVYAYGSRVFEIIPSDHYFLQIGTLLI